MSLSPSPLPPADNLKVKELQAYLKQFGCKCSGKKDALKALYEAERIKRESSVVVVTSLLHSEMSTRGNNNHEVGSTPTKPDIEKKKKKANTEEKRLRPFRSKASQKLQERIDRAYSQKLFLVQKELVEDKLEGNFVVLGSTGNIYKIIIGRLVSCSCPDFQKGNLCKHVLFVMIKVVGLSRESPLIFQVALVESELLQIFDMVKNRRVGGGVLANERVQQAFASLCKGEGLPPEGAARKPLEGDSDCPICFDSMNAGTQTLTYCRSTCGANFHNECIQHWLGQNTRGQSTCPNCRQPWEDDRKRDTGNSSKEAYTNLGKIQGQSSVLDTSTYRVSGWRSSRGGKKRSYEYESS
jgi:hypothetical protein